MRLHRDPQDAPAARAASRRRRLVLGGIAAVLLGGGAAWAVIAARGDAPVQQGGGPSAGAMEGMAGMEEMSGMQMSSDGTVRLSAGQLRQFGITFATAEMDTLRSELRTVGSVTFAETRIAQVAPRFGGYVERLYVETTGQPVRRGQPLMDVYSPEVLAAQEELLVARRLDRSLGESAVPGVPVESGELLAAARRRLRLLDVSDAQIDEVLRTGRPRRTVTLYAPASGVVVNKQVVQGQAIMPGAPLYTIADLAEVWVDVELREGDIGAVRPGSAADLEFAAYAGREFKGRVAYVYPTLRAESRTVRARIEVANGERLLKPGMYATVRLTTPTRRVLAVPATAVIRTGERNVVFVDMGGGQLMPHDVATGASIGGKVEVLSGLEAGHRVVTSAQFLLESESNLGEVMKSMLSMGGSGMRDMEGMDTPGAAQGADMRGMPGMKMPAAPPAAGRKTP